MSKLRSTSAAFRPRCARRATRSAGSDTPGRSSADAPLRPRRARPRSFPDTRRPRTRRRETRKDRSAMPSREAESSFPCTSFPPQAMSPGKGSPLGRDPGTRMNPAPRPGPRSAARTRADSLLPGRAGLARTTCVELLVGAVASSRPPGFGGAASMGAFGSQCRRRSDPGARQKQLRPLSTKRGLCRHLDRHHSAISRASCRCVAIPASA